MENKILDNIYKHSYVLYNNLKDRNLLISSKNNTGKTHLSLITLIRYSTYHPEKKCISIGSSNNKYFANKIISFSKEYNNEILTLDNIIFTTTTLTLAHIDYGAVMIDDATYSYNSYDALKKTIHSLNCDKLIVNGYLTLINQEKLIEMLDPIYINDNNIHELKNYSLKLKLKKIKEKIKEKHG